MNCLRPLLAMGYRTQRRAPGRVIGLLICLVYMLCCGCVRVLIIISRRRFRPLEFSRNETVVYGRRKSGTFPTVVDVQRAADIEHNKKLQEQKEAFKVRAC